MTLTDILASYREKDIRLEAIVTHENHVVENWGFLIYHEGKLYFMVRKEGLPKLSRLAKQMPDIFDIPIIESEKEIARISKGAFIWTKKLEEL